jgi:ankyrin repeat protein
MRQRKDRRRWFDRRWRGTIEADSKNEVGRTPLSRAPEEGHEAVVRLLVGQDDVEADSKDDDGMTPLSLALE